VEQQQQILADVPGYAARPDNAVGRRTFGTWLFRQSWPSPASDKSRAQRCLPLSVIKVFETASRANGGRLWLVWLMTLRGSPLVLQAA